MLPRTKYNLIKFSEIKVTFGRLDILPSHATKDSVDIGIN
jgi:hypothetical protein